MHFLVSVPKIYPEKFLIFFSKKSALKSFLYFLKKTPNFLKAKIPKKSLYFSKRNLLILAYFGKGVFRTLAYLELEAYLEPKVFLEPEVYSEPLHI